MSSEKTVEILKWTYSPWRSNWLRPAGALLVELFVAGLAGYSFTTPDWWPSALAWGGFSLIVLLAATMTIYTPVTYRLDAKGVTVRFLGAPSFRKWEHYRNYYMHEPGVHLTTMPSPSPLDPFRGHMLMFDGNRETVLAFIRAHIVRDEKQADAASKAGE